MQVLGGCIVLMKQKASFVSASFNESRYEIQGFLHTLFLENEAQTSEKKPKQCISSKTKSTCQNSTTSEHFQKWPKNQGVVLALSLSLLVLYCNLSLAVFFIIWFSALSSLCVAVSLPLPPPTWNGSEGTSTHVESSIPKQVQPWTL